MNTEALHAFALVAEHGRFQDAADELGITQQAVSKRIAALEQRLGVPLFTRGRHRAELTVDGQAFLPHAKAVLLAAEAAVRSVQPTGRALRVDVLGRRVAANALVIDFHTRHPDIRIDVITVSDIKAAFHALLGGSIDATFRYIRDPDALPGGIEHRRVYDEPLDLLVGPRHPLAKSPGVRLSDLADHRIWIPGIVAGSEWGDYYVAMAEEFGLHIDSTGPNFGVEHLLDTIADSPTLATTFGARTRIAWLTGHGLRRVPIRHPTPVYPWSLAWHTVNRHPDLDELRDHLSNLREPTGRPGTWTPSSGPGPARTGERTKTHPE
ncbi:LysR family transcriptional regulator [Rhizohabitans arisaemae]|uniref:LysR family transcriptional regulator n=1 Tax=Rhizohabitans arisaemae TaxID=2720610 RepID=UPI0024B082AC|nr:LysR family transcriptional regulator [Rhizohabitans arisaemae]